MKILLDPLIYWFPNNQEKDLNLQYLNEVTLAIEKYFDIKYIASKEFINTLLKLNKEPFKFGKEQETLKSIIIKRLLQNLDYPNNLNITNDSSYLFPDNFKITENIALNHHFSSVMNYLLQNNIECILFLSRENHTCKFSSYDKFYIVKHIAGEVDSKITELLQDGKYIKNGLSEPNLFDPLPFSELCNHFYDLQNEMRKIDDAMSVFFKITKEVALRNRYSFDEVVTNKNCNAKHKRKIYTYKKNHYISADFESGCFELCNHRGIHQGEISYIGTLLSQPDKEHHHDIII